MVVVILQSYNLPKYSYVQTASKNYGLNNWNNDDFRDCNSQNNYECYKLSTNNTI